MDWEHKYPSYSQTMQGSGFDAPTKTTETSLSVTLNDGNPLDLVSAVREQVTNDSSTTTWRYESASGVLSLESGEGRVASWTLDSVGLLQAHEATGFGSYAFTYLGDSRLKRVEHSDGLTTRAYDITRRIEMILSFIR